MNYDHCLFWSDRLEWTTMKGEIPKKTISTMLGQAYPGIQGTVNTEVATTEGGGNTQLGGGGNLSNQQSLQCCSCNGTGHVVKNCPQCFCQSCGNRGHDRWDTICPKYQWPGTILECNESNQADSKNGAKANKSLPLPFPSPVIRPVEVFTMSAPEDCVTISINAKDRNLRSLLDWQENQSLIEVQHFRQPSSPTI